MSGDPLRSTLKGIGVVTSLSGATQMMRPAFVLGQIATDESPLGRHLFGTVGMFMTVSGATLHRAVSAPLPDRRLLMLAAGQKLGAAGAVALGVRHRLFVREALLVASFDLASGVLCLVYARRGRVTDDLSGT